MFVATKTDTFVLKEWETNNIYETSKHHRMANERLTENLVRDILDEFGYKKDETIYIEEQRSKSEEITKLLRNASKTGKGGKGAPEFIITTSTTPDFIVVIECKALISQHKSETLLEAKNYAVDGALHYAKYLSKEFNVIAIGASGQKKEEMKIDVLLYPKNGTEYKVLCNKFQKPIQQIIPLTDFIEHASFDPEVEKSRHADLMAFSRDLHEFMRDHAKLTESEKPLLVSGTLIALRNKAFSKSYDAYTPAELQKEWMRVIKTEFNKAEIPNAKIDNMTQPYSSISVHPELGKATESWPKGVLYELIKRLNEKVWPFITVYHDFDVVGQFYGEFLKYTGGDKKALGIVLTPRHITELFALLAMLKKDSKVLDICTGTGGFLISSMSNMLNKCVTENEIQHVKMNCLIGVEQQPNMYALAASNMILRGDGRANLYQGSCFDTAIVKALKAHKCNVAMLNPPYSQSDESLHELYFVKRALDCIEKGGLGIAIVPISCALSDNRQKEILLKHHTLEAVMSMPDELFYPVGVVTCIMVFRAKIPHEDSNIKTWFAYWKNDGFIKTKMEGRIDQGNWKIIRDSWIEAYKNRDDIPGMSIKQYVTAYDEWCAEAYMETDYSQIKKEDFEQTIKNYISFKIQNSK